MVMQVAVAEQRESVEEPRSAMISARPPLTMAAVAICWYSRIGSSSTARSPQSTV
jgi:hypothetical protein